MNILKTIGGSLLGLAIFIAIALTTILFFTFGTAFAFNIAPFINGLAGILLLLDLIILIFAVIPSARGFVGLVLFMSSYIFGLSTWIYGLAVALSLWGVVAVIVGLVLGGVGVVPIGMLASIFHGRWDIFLTLFLTLALTYGSRIIGNLLVNSSEKTQVEDEVEIIDIEPDKSNERKWGDIE